MEIGRGRNCELLAVSQLRVCGFQLGLKGGKK
jgi:hypothetical protein